MTVAFEKGRFSAIMGPSGSGKSTLLHCIAGLDDLTSGSAFIGDVRLGDLNDRALTLLRREKVGFIFQAFNLIPTLDAAENITLPIDIAGGEVDQPWYDVVVDTIGLRLIMAKRRQEFGPGQELPPGRHEPRELRGEVAADARGQPAGLQFQFAPQTSDPPALDHQGREPRAPARPLRRGRRPR
jgi:ABC-type sugar transport system ATPase subunit